MPIQLSNPDYQKMFVRFAHVPQSELMQNGDFLTQSFTTLAGLNVIIQSMSSQELLAQELSHMGTIHFDSGLKVYMFEVCLVYTVLVPRDRISC